MNDRGRQSVAGRLIARLFFLATLLLSVQVLSAVRAEDAFLMHRDVFTGGSDRPEGYRLFRLPSIVVHKEVVIIFAEGRENRRDDPGTSDSMDIVYKRSEDGGLTWGSLQVLADGTDHYPDLPKSNVAYQPTTVLDNDHGYSRLFTFYNRAQTRPFYRYSDDLGLTWSEEISFLERINNRPESFKKLSVNLASGVRMSDGKLVIPMNTVLPDDPAGTNRPSVAYSDDHGATWHYGGHSAPGANEHQITEVFNGNASRLYSSSRRDGRSQNSRRINYGIYNENTGQWDWGCNSTPVDGNGSEIMANAVSAGVERYTQANVNGETISRLLLTIPHGKNSAGLFTRRDLSVYVSTDEGSTYDRPRVLLSGLAAYSDIANVNGDRFLVAWERDPAGSHGFITLTMANRHFLDSHPTLNPD
ncbi:sialidase family protein [Endozoicomonas sp.]|uniref:sialidase family protein n=1 Tax=Endozoicomonas sp. TaxID=1892382 RepID=UPI002883BA03|nr:sialidase family protein [Endozoicomonas sp.]